MPQALSDKALAKWADERLSTADDDQRHFVFRYQGSQCHGGGSAYEVLMHVHLSDRSLAAAVEHAWIEVPEDQRPAVRQLCGCSGHGDRFFTLLATPPPLRGRSLADVLADPGPLNPAGCCCCVPMRNHKWRNVLATIDYVLRQEQAG